MRIQRRLRLVTHPGRTSAWDIHSPRVPSATEIETGLRIAIAYLPADRIWVNSDCDLKTFPLRRGRTSAADPGGRRSRGSDTLGLITQTSQVQILSLLLQKP
jgi:hypothetical protein